MLTAATARVAVNVDDATIVRNVRANAARPLAWVEAAAPPCDTAALLVGGGPSLAGQLDDLRRRVAAGGILYAVNGAAKYLAEHGIAAHFQIVIDARLGNETFLVDGVPAILCSQCDPALVDRCPGALLFHPPLDNIDQVLADFKRPYLVIGGGTTAGLTALALAYSLGHRLLHLYGYDSSFAAGRGQHAYAQARTEQEAREMTVSVGGAEFTTTPVLLAQAQGFNRLAHALVEQGAEIAVHGDGLLPAVARAMMIEPGPLDLTYDLSTHPVTWDFLQWLVNAEMHRKRYGYERLRVKFEGTFRREVAAGITVRDQKRMLEGIVRPLLRCVGAEEGGDGGPIVFPYTLWPAAEAYAAQEHLPTLVPSEAATAWAERWRGYVTITLREADYWPNRNSDLAAWLEFARLIHKVVFVRDTAKADQPLIDGPFTFETCPEASEDADKRLALYRAAKINLFVGNGPMMLAALSPDIPYIAFIKPDPDYPCYQGDWYRQFHGIAYGEQWPWAGRNQRMIFAADSFDNIVRAYWYGAVQRAAS